MNATTCQATVAVACTNYGNSVGCEYCSYDCHYGGCNCSYNIEQATATTTTATTASTPTLRSNTSNTIMAYVNGQYAHGMHWGQCTLRLLELGQCTLRLHAMSTAAATAPHSPQSGCKLQAANCKLPTANCKLQSVLLWQHAPR